MTRISDKAPVQVGATGQNQQVDLDALRAQLLAPPREGELADAKQVLGKLLTQQVGVPARGLVSRLQRGVERGATQLDSEVKAQLQALGDLVGRLALP